MKKIVVPEGMREAADAAISDARKERSSRPGVPGGNAELRLGEVEEITIQAALRSLSENPVIPTKKQMDSIRAGLDDYGYDQFRLVVREWQRIMFLAPELEVPEEIKDLLFSSPGGIPVVLHDNCVSVQEQVNDRIIEAHSRGKKSRPA